MNKVHIGKKIKARIEERGMSIAEVARRLNRTPQSIHQIFGRSSIDTETLQEFGDVLEFNFFALYIDKDTVVEVPKVQKNRRRMALTIDIDDPDQQKAVLKLLGVKLQ